MEQRPAEFSGSFQEKAENPKFELDTRNLKFFKEDIFNLPFKNIPESSNYKHFQHVFTDEDDYEDFKQNLVNFHNLRSRWKDDRKKVSKARPKINSGDFDRSSSYEEQPMQTDGATHKGFHHREDDDDDDDGDDFYSRFEKHKNTLERQRTIDRQRLFDFKNTGSGSLDREQRNPSNDRREIQIQHSDPLERNQDNQTQRSESLEGKRQIQIQHTGSLERKADLQRVHSDSLERKRQTQIESSDLTGRRKEIQPSESSERRKEIQIQHTDSLKGLNKPQAQNTDLLGRTNNTGVKPKDLSVRKKNELDLSPSRMFKPLPMMEFFQNDEHFQEFDRVFETVKNKRRYASNSSLDKYRWSPRNEGEKSDEEVSDNDADDGGVFKVDDIFSDFFDNDADFKNFEVEFENFQLKRRSKALPNWQRNSVCDLIEDLKAFCDTDDTTSSTKTSLPVENKLSLPKLWNQSNQGGEWDYIFNKLRCQGQPPSVSDSDTGRSDLTVRCDSESGDYLLDDISDSGSLRDTRYNSELPKLNSQQGNTCSACQRNPG